MSFVIAAMKPGYSVIAGDTQLNDENGSRLETGIKIFPIIDEHTILGLVGDYCGYLNTIQLINKKSDNNQLSFAEKTTLVSKLLRENCRDYNGIMVYVKNGRTCYSIFSSKEEESSDFHIVSNGEVKVLVPPDITEEFCYPYVNSIIDLKSQAIRCVKAVGKCSSSVNDKVFGAELTNSGVKFFTDGILYDDITVRIV